MGGIFSVKENTLNLSSHYLFLFSLVSTYSCFCVTYMGEDRQDFVRRVRHKAFTEPRLWKEGSLLFYHFSIPPHQLGKHPHISTSKYINPDSLLKHYTGKICMEDAVVYLNQTYRGEISIVVGTFCQTWCEVGIYWVEHNSRQFVEFCTTLFGKSGHLDQPFVGTKLRQNPI